MSPFGAPWHEPHSPVCALSHVGTFGLPAWFAPPDSRSATLASVPWQYVAVQFPNPFPATCAVPWLYAKREPAIEQSAALISTGGQMSRVGQGPCG